MLSLSAPRRLLLLPSLLLMAALLLAAPDAQAGSYVVTYSTNNTFQDKGFDSLDDSNPITATLTWQGSGPAPAVVVEEDSDASWFIDGSGTGKCSCGLPNPSRFSNAQLGDESATRYTVYPAPASGSITLPTVTTSGNTMLSPGEETDNFVNLSYTVSIVNGNWDGPYYFHYGSYLGGTSSPDGPWPNNTAGPTPTIGDENFAQAGAGSNLFTLTSTGTTGCVLQGSVTPVWFWDGPDLGVAPPGFSISVSTDAICSDYYQTYSQADVDDGLENTFVKNTSNTKHTSDADTKSVMVQSDSYAPGEGNGYWAIGPPIKMSAQINDVYLSNNTSLYDAIVLTASISGPSQ